MATTQKDIQRILDIQSQPGKELTLAGKMAKLIKDSSKIERRYNASVQILGHSHVVTNIFWRRMQEINGTITNTITPEMKEVAKVETPFIPEPEVVINRIKRSQSDFPIGINVKFNGNVGQILSHEDNEEIVTVQFESSAEEVNIYDLKRA